MRLFKKQLVVLTLNVLVFLVLASTISNYTTSYFEGEATSGTSSITLPTAASDSSTAFTTSTIFSGTGGLNSISPSQTSIGSAITTTHIYLGVDGYLLGSTSSTAQGVFFFKTTNYITSISATFKKYSTELAQITLRSGNTSGTGLKSTSYTLLSDDSTKTVQLSNTSSFYFAITTGTSSTNNNIYLSSLSYEYDNNIYQSLAYSFNFINGGSSGTNDYTLTNSQTDISYELDNPGGTSGTTSWTADWANLSLTTGTRIGTGSTAADSSVRTDDTTAWANIRSNFTFSESINVVRIINAVIPSSSINSIYLQSSSDGSSWTTVSVRTTANINNSVLTFNEFTIDSNSYIRIGITTNGSEANRQFHFTGMQILSYSLCN